MPPLAVRRHAHGDHQGIQAVQPVRLHRHADLRRERRSGGNPNCARQSRHSAASCTATRAMPARAAQMASTPTRSSTPSATRTSCRSGSTTSTRSSCPKALTDKQVSAIDTERALLAPERLRQVVGYTLEHFDQKTKRSAASTRSAGKTSSTASTPSSRRPRSSCQAVLHRVPEAAEGLDAGPAVQDRH